MTSMEKYQTHPEQSQINCHQQQNQNMIQQLPGQTMAQPLLPPPLPPFSKFNNRQEYEAVLKQDGLERIKQLDRCTIIQGINSSKAQSYDVFIENDCSEPILRIKVMLFNFCGSQTTGDIQSISYSGQQGQFTADIETQKLFKVSVVDKCSFMNNALCILLPCFCCCVDLWCNSCFPLKSTIKSDKENNTFTGQFVHKVIGKEIIVNSQSSNETFAKIVRKSHCCYTQYVKRYDVYDAKGNIRQDYQIKKIIDPFHKHSSRLTLIFPQNLSVEDKINLMYASIQVS